MVIDSLKHTEIYERINPLFAKAFEFIKKTDFSQIEPGKIELEGEDLFLIVSDSNLKDKVAAKLEVHNQYIDIQIPVSQSESFGWKGRRNLHTQSDDFDLSRDIQFFEDVPDSYFSVSPGSFVAFWPQDAHAPCIGEGVIRKVVVKIKANK